MLLSVLSFRCRKYEIGEHPDHWQAHSALHEQLGQVVSVCEYERTCVLRIVVVLTSWLWVPVLRTVCVLE